MNKNPYAFLAASILFLLSSIFASTTANAGKSCRSGFKTYRHGNYRCTLGRKDQCWNGRWKYRGKCAFFGRFCHYGSKNYVHGKLRCTGGKRYQCRRGRWKRVGNCNSGGRDCRSGFVKYKHGQFRCTLGTKHQCRYGAWVKAGKCGLFGYFCHIGSKSYKTNTRICFKKYPQKIAYIQKCHPGNPSKLKRAFWQTMWGTPGCCVHKGQSYRPGQIARVNYQWKKCQGSKWVKK